MNQNHRYTLIELLVVIALLVSLASLFNPALQNLIQRAKQTTCLENLRHLGVANLSYTEDFDGWMVVASVPYGATGQWSAELAAYLSLPWENRDQVKAHNTVMECPSSNFFEFGTSPIYGGYGYNYRYLGYFDDPKYWESVNSPQYDRQNIKQATSPTRTVQIGDCVNYEDANQSWEYGYIYTPATKSFPYLRHQGGFDVQWLDGHASFELWDEFKLGVNGDSAWNYKLVKE